MQNWTLKIILTLNVIDDNEGCLPISCDDNQNNNGKSLFV